MVPPFFLEASLIGAEVDVVTPGFLGQIVLFGSRSAVFAAEAEFVTVAFPAHRTMNKD
jgi:hypothetical protein